MGSSYNKSLSSILASRYTWIHLPQWTAPIRSLHITCQHTRESPDTRTALTAFSRRRPRVSTAFGLSSCKTWARQLLTDDKTASGYEPVKIIYPGVTIREMKNLENKGLTFKFEELPPAVLRYAKACLRIATLDELTAKYRQLVSYRTEDKEKTPDSQISPRRRHDSVELEGVPLRYRRGVGWKSPEHYLCPVDVGVANMLFSLAKYQHGASRSGVHSTKDKPYEKYIIRDGDAMMAVECSTCGKKSTDKTVRWWKLHPEFYVAYSTNACPTVGCFGSRRWMKPVNKEQPWRKGETSFLIRKRMKPPENIVTKYFSPSYGNLPRVVRVRCSSCGSAAIDDMPRWSGHENSRYLCPLWKCAECAQYAEWDKRRSHFEPDDSAIARITLAYSKSLIKSGKMPARRGEKFE